jgi:RNA polymerase sigma factor (sigma-70 family)
VDTTRHSLLIRVRDPADQAAWFEFDGIYRPMLQRFARTRGLGPAEADEIAQQCMTAVHRYIGGFEYDPTKGRFKAWLRTMVNNRIKNLVRDRREMQAETGELRRLLEPGESPEELFDTVWRQEHLRHCLRRIKTEVEDSTFKAFVAYVMEERPIDEVCRELDMTANQVHAIKSRLTKRIRDRMFELLGAEE